MQTTGLFTTPDACTVLADFNVLGIVFAGKDTVVRPAAETLLTVAMLNAGWVILIAGLDAEIG